MQNFLRPQSSSLNELRPDTSQSRAGAAALTSWVGNMVRSSKQFKERARVLDQFIYLVYGTVVSQKDLERAKTVKTIDISDGVVMTELLDRAKFLCQGSEIPSKSERNLFLLKSKEQIISSYIQDCQIMLGLDLHFSADQFLKGQVAPHILIEHFFTIYQLIAERFGLALFHFDHIFNEHNDPGSLDNSLLQMSQIQETIKMVLQSSSKVQAQNKQKKESQSHFKFGNAIKAKPEFKYINRDRLIQKLDKFYVPLNEQQLLPSFEHNYTDAALECERMHIDDFNQYYQRVTQMDSNLQKLKRIINKKDKEIAILREVIENQNKLLNGLNIDIGLLSNEKVMKYRSRSQQGMSERNRALTMNPNHIESHHLLGADTLVNESRRLSKQIKTLTVNFDKEIRRKATGNVNKRKASNVSAGNLSQKSDDSLLSSRSIGLQTDNQFLNKEDQLHQLSELGSQLEAESLAAKEQGQPRLSKEIDSLGNTIEVKLEKEEDDKQETGQRKKWVSQKWIEVIQKLEREKAELENEVIKLQDKLRQNGGSIERNSLKQKEIDGKLKEKELLAKRKEQEYSILLSESTRLRTELDQALRVNKPMAIKLEQATHQIRQLREQNIEYRKYIIELKVEIARLKKETIPTEDEEQVKDLVTVLENKVKSLQSKNSKLKDQLQQATFKSNLKTPNRFS